MIFANHKLTNVWEVIQINGQNLLVALEALSSARSHLNKFSSKLLQDQKKINDLKLALDMLTAELEKLESKLAIAKVKLIKEILDNLDDFDVEVIAGEISSSLDEVQSRIQDDLETRLLYYFDQKEAKLIENGQRKFSPEVFDKFTEATEDLDEAVKCLGFSRYTACVFHLMRAMECATRIIGTKLNVTTINKYEKHLSWGLIVKNINDKIDATPRGDEYKKWSEISTLLDHVRMCWRNETMHPKQTYTEEEARAVFEAVKVFLDRFAQKLKTN